MPLFLYQTPHPEKRPLHSYFNESPPQPATPSHYQWLLPNCVAIQIDTLELDNQEYDL